MNPKVAQPLAGRAREPICRLARMTRAVSLVVAYSLFAALVVAAPLSASEPPGEQPAAAEALEAASGQPGEPTPAAPEPPVPQPAPAAPELSATAQSAAQPAPAAPEPAPADAVPAEPAELRDTAPVPEVKADKRAKLVTAAAASGAVTISDFQFAPASVTVNVGDTVTWSNAGPTAHSATATGGSFDTGVFPEGESRSHTFDEAGTFSYICTPHPQMKGTVTVKAAAAQQGDDGTSTGDASGSGADGGSTTADTGSGTESGSTSTLPETGLDAGGVLALGLMTLALGALLLRRSAGAG
jgi:plastocyanin